MNCPHCNSTNIETDMRVFEQGYGSRVGFRFKKGVMLGIAQIHCDVCRDCGTIVRSYIVDSMDKKWRK